MAVVGILVASGFEQSEMTILCRSLAESGHAVLVISPKKQEVRSWDHARWNGDLPVDAAVADADLGRLAALILPGGVMSADTLRADEAAVRLVREAAASGRIVAALGHAAWVAVEAGLVRGRAVTSHPAIRTDLVNAGALWQDQAVVVDGGLITGRHGHDTDAFARAVGATLAGPPTSSA